MGLLIKSLAIFLPTYWRNWDFGFGGRQSQIFPNSSPNKLPLPPFLWLKIKDLPCLQPRLRAQPFPSAGHTGGSSSGEAAESYIASGSVHRIYLQLGAPCLFLPEASFSFWRLSAPLAAGDPEAEWIGSGHGIGEEGMGLFGESQPDPRDL